MNEQSNIGKENMERNGEGGKGGRKEEIDKNIVKDLLNQFMAQFSWKYEMGYLNTCNKKPEQHWYYPRDQSTTIFTKMHWEGIEESSVKLSTAMVIWS